VAYATEDDLRTKWGSDQVDLLAYDDAAKAVSPARIANALANAAATIDSYLGRRYALPVNPQPDAALLLTDLCADLAASKLASTPGTRNDIVVDAEKRVLAFLRDIADGKAALNLIPPPSAGDPISPGEAVMITETRALTRCRMRGL
jgi:phage gp36-like protein